MDTYNNPVEIEQTLKLLGSDVLDLSNQPQTFKGITKKLNTLIKDLNSFEVIVPTNLENIDEHIEQIKSKIPKWALVTQIPSDGRVSTPEAKQEAAATLDELEAYINSASTENLMDLHCAVVQSLVIAAEQKYRFDKLCDYRDNLESTKLVCKDTHRSLSQLGMGIESALPSIVLFTDAPSGINYKGIQVTLEDKTAALTKVLKMIGSLGVTVIISIAFNYLLRFGFYLVELLEKKIRKWFDRDKRTTTSKKTVSTKKYIQKRQAHTSNPSTTKASEVYTYANNVNLSVAEISLAALYRDTANGRLKEAEIDDLYAAASGRNIKDMKTLWDTMRVVLDSLDKSLKDTIMTMRTMQTSQSINDPAIDPTALEDSVITVKRLEDSFKKYDSPKVDVARGLDIIKEVAQIYAKGDLPGFERRLTDIKKQLIDLDKAFGVKQTEEELTPQMREFLMKRIYLLRTTVDYLSRNMKLQTRFQTLAIKHAKIFAANLDSIEAFEADMDKPDEMDGAIPA